MTVLYAKIKNGHLEFTNQRELEMYCEENRDYRGLIAVQLNKTTRERTEQQSRALHLWFKLVADSLNEAGLTVQKVLEKKMELEWNKDLVKELWRDAQKRIVGKQSTTKLDKVSEIDLIRDHFIRHFAEKFDGYELPEFPHDPDKVT